MQESSSSAPDSPRPATLPKWRDRRFLGRAAIAIFVIGGVLLFRPPRQVELAVVFELPPTVRTSSGIVPRIEASGLEVRVRDPEGAEVGRADLKLRNQAGPLTPAVPLHVPAGRYLVQVTVKLGDGRQAALGGVFEAEDDGTVRVELR